jgi:hypothetical protein
MGQKGGGKGKGGVMTQSLYAHMNKGNLKKEKRRESIYSKHKTRSTHITRYWDRTCNE